MRVVISYLVPSYNHEKYLPFLLESIRQDIDFLDVPAEVLIIDDGSRDNSTTIIKEWADTQANQIKITYRSQENQGISAVFNALITMAEGEYLRICASDDVVVAGSTNLLFQHLKKKPEALCALADGRVIDSEGAEIHSSSIRYHGASPERLTNPAQLTQELIQRWCVAGPALLIKRAHYDTMRYDESSKIEDYDLFLSLLEKPNSIIFVNEVVCLYRIHETNTSKTKNREQRIINMKSFVSIINRYVDKKQLAHYLLPVKYESIAKINFLQKQYLKCAINMMKSLFFKIKGNCLHRC